MFQRRRFFLKGFTLIELMIVIAIIAILASILIPNFLRARQQSMYTACQANLKSIGTALEMYATDYSQRYPASLDLLTTQYLKGLPSCPVTGTVTYTASGSYSSTTNPDAFTVMCKGSNHTAVSPGGVADLPQYTSIGGLQK